MEWFSNVMRDARQYLRRHGWMKTVAWQDVIQLDPQLDQNPPYKARIVADLVKWEKTDAGQTMITSLRDAQSRIPNNERWNSAGEYALANPSDSPAYHRDLAAIKARHTNSKKLFLYVSPDKEAQFSTYDRYTNGGYAGAEHIIVINPTVRGWASALVPKMVNGKKQFAPESFIEVLQHETQHAVDFLNRKFARTTDNMDKPYSYECRETRALHAEQTLQSELGLTRRYAYNDITLELQQTIQKGATATPEAYQDLREQLITMASIDILGCSVENPPLLWAPKGAADVEAEVDRAIRAQGITIVDSQPRPARGRK